MKNTVLILVCMVIANLAIATTEVESKEPTKKEAVAVASDKKSGYDCADIASLDTDEALESCTTISNKSLLNLQKGLLERHKEDNNAVILLTNMQDAWIEFRDAQCEYLGRSNATRRDGARTMLKCEIQQNMTRAEALGEL